MNPNEAANVLKSMIAFIKTHGDERASNIKHQGDQQYTADIGKLGADMKEKILKDYEAKIQGDEIKLRIQKSADQNADRI
jgi:hypothetical protein